MATKAILILVLLNFYTSSVKGDFKLTPSSDTNVRFKNIDGSRYDITYTNDATGDMRRLGYIAEPFTSQPREVANDYVALLNYPTEGSRKEANLRVSAVATPQGHVHINVRWSAAPNITLMDCYNLSTAQWFGGPEQKYQYWPVQKLNLSDYSYVSKEAENNAVTEPYWINSEGTILYVNKETPLFIDQNREVENHICLKAQIKPPYSSDRQENVLSYDIVITENAKIGHMYAVGRYLGKPIAYPDYRMIQHPIWSTWARYARPIDQEILINFANEIIENGFNNSQFEIDDLWETCYGSFEIDTNKFPDFKGMIKYIKSLGFRVTMWIHPFINLDCEPWHSAAKAKGYLVTSEDGNVNTSWWNNNGSIGSYIDFTNSEATTWWMERIINLQNEYEIDSFKFDAGESSWSPQVPVQKGSSNEHPSHIVIDYVRAVAEFGPMIEVRSAQRTQDLPIFVRMLDKDTYWDFNNGLPTLVTTLLQMNMNGYPLVLPDMIGGNGYNEKPSKELFIRWLQANTFMPSLQYSFVPWDFDNETIRICKEYTELHAEYSPLIAQAMVKAVEDGTPVNPPIWWLDPTDEVALSIWDEYLLGDKILVAPVLEKDQVKRDIYLPKGNWFYRNYPQVFFRGGEWYRDFPASLDNLPWFTKDLIASSASKTISSTLLLIFAAINILMYWN